METACDVPETLSGRHTLLGHWRRGLLRGQVASTCSMGGCDWSPGGSRTRSGQSCLVSIPSMYEVLQRLRCSLWMLCVRAEPHILLLIGLDHGLDHHDLPRL